MPSTKPHQTSPFTKKRLLGALGAAVLATASASIFASSIAPDDPRLKPASVLTMNIAGFNQIFIDGYIHAPTVDTFKKIISTNPNGRGIVYFNSGGGDIRAAMELGRLLRANGYATHIGKITADGTSVKTGICASACPIAFIGGTHRLLQTETGALAVHQFYKANADQKDGKHGLVFTTHRDLKAYIAEMGISSEFYDLIVSTPADRIVKIGKDAEHYWKLRSNDQTQKWEAGAGNWIAGHKTSILGEFALTFECASGKVKATAGFKPWFPAAALLDFDTHKLLIDSKAYELERVTGSYDTQTGMISFSTELSPLTAQTVSSSATLGYSLSSENQFGSYAYDLKTPVGRDYFDAFWRECSSPAPKIGN